MDWQRLELLQVRWADGAQWLKYMQEENTAAACERMQASVLPSEKPRESSRG